MQTLNFPPCFLRYRQQDGKPAAFDVIRKKFVLLTPEEWVRQHVVHYLIVHKKYPKSLVSVEKMLKVNGLAKRYDVVVFNTDGNVQLIVECKAPNVRISQDVFDQIARYNMTVDARLLMVTNGLDHYYCTMDREQARYNFLADLPSYETSAMKT